MEQSTEIEAVDKTSLKALMRNLEYISDDLISKLDNKDETGLINEVRKTSDIIRETLDALNKSDGPKKAIDEILELKKEINSLIHSFDPEVIELTVQSSYDNTLILNGKMDKMAKEWDAMIDKRFRPISEGITASINLVDRIAASDAEDKAEEVKTSELFSKIMKKLDQLEEESFEEYGSLARDILISSILFTAGAASGYALCFFV